MVLLLTGWRYGELYHLRNRDIYFDQVYLPMEGKTGKRIYPILEKAYSRILQFVDLPRLLMENKHDGEYFLKTSKGNHPSYTWLLHRIRHYAKESKLPIQCSAHTLRHTFASHLLMSGANVKAVQELMGHSSVQTTEIYIHITHSALNDLL